MKIIWKILICVLLVAVLLLWDGYYQDRKNAVTYEDYEYLNKNLCEVKRSLHAMSRDMLINEGLVNESTADAIFGIYDRLEAIEKRIKD